MRILPVIAIVISSVAMAISFYARHLQKQTRKRLEAAQKYR